MVVVQLVGQLEQFHTNMVGEAVIDMKIFLSNLAKLSQLESGNCHSWVRAMTSCQAQLVEHLVRPDMRALVLELFRLVP